MIKTKEQKGITLIALIITIIVLLILAVVAISAVQDDGIINHAKNARDQYGAEQEKENTTLQSYLDKIKDNVPTGTGTATGNNGGNGNQNTGKPITFTIWGTTYNDAVEGDTWTDWIKKQEKDSEWTSYNGYLAKYGKGYTYVCTENGERVAVTAQIMDGYRYSKGLEFTISGETWNAAKDETWEEWCERIGNDEDYLIHDDYVVFSEPTWKVSTSEGKEVKKDDIIEPGHAYKVAK